MQEQQASREILFHGKNRTTKQWVEGYYLKRGEATLIYDLQQQGVGHFVDPKTVGQYVNRTDKNGRKIFEGDVVQVCFKDGDIENYEVVFDDIFLGFRLRSTNPYRFPRTISMPAVGDEPLKDAEVIGNVYDNPELLEVAR